MVPDPRNNTAIKGFDFNPFNGINYYRLRQVDFDGHSTYSDMIARNYSQSQL
jgi:hypothetical protein